MFAAIVAGTTAERLSLKAYIIFVVLWSIFVYIPICHWVWCGGFLRKLGLVDFARGTVVHISPGASSIAAAIFVSKRKFQNNDVSNLGYVVIGAAILWFGWLTFNVASALAANETAALAVTNTHISASIGLQIWMLLTYKYEKRHPLYPL